MSAEIIDKDLHELITGIDRDEYFPVEKLDAHVRNVPHVAISVFIFDEQRLLLQKRALTKYHSGGLWANTVCSHPRWQESAVDCAHRRLNEELGLQIPLTSIGEITYASRVGELYENETVQCFSGQFDRKTPTDQYNRNEVSEVLWLTMEEILDDMQQNPDTYTAWFKIYMKQHRDLLSNQ